MRTIPGLILALVTAAIVGLGLTALSVREARTAASLFIGPWIMHARAGTPEIDPYTRALYARNGILPLAQADGLELFAETDSKGRPLDGRCRLLVGRQVPAARYWTLTLHDDEGHAVPNEAGRSSFTSTELVRESDGAFVVHVAPTAQEGNWLPTGGVKNYRLVLRLYDTLVAGALGPRDAPSLPALTQEGCP